MEASAVGDGTGSEHTHLASVMESDEWSCTSSVASHTPPGGTPQSPQSLDGEQKGFRRLSADISSDESTSHVNLFQGSGILRGSHGGVFGTPTTSDADQFAGSLPPIRERSRHGSFDSRESWESREANERGSPAHSGQLLPPPMESFTSGSMGGSFRSLGDDQGSFKSNSSGSFHFRRTKRKRRRSVEEERMADKEELAAEAKALMLRRRTFEDHLMKIPRKKRAQAVRCNCSEEQLQSPVWKFLLDVMTTGKGEPDPMNIRDADDVDFIYEQLVEKSQHTLYTPGPVGDLPMHMVFLLAYGGNTPKMLTLGKRLIDEFYTGDDINMAYTSDLDTPVFKHLDFRPEDSGKYTGETVLHIAIVNKDKELVCWLLERNASLESRATGAFFRPGVIRRRSKQSWGYEKWVQMKVQNRNLKSEPFMKERGNLEGAFGRGKRYFGEFPLSFAASMGDVEMLQLLHDFMTRARNEPELSEAELQKQKKKRIWRMLNAQDDLGNTAMHMAVLHRHVDVFDWLHANGAESSMSILNEDALTPFTLAVRLGFTDMYHHIYKKYFSDIVFKFGEMQLFKTSLEQIDTFRIDLFPLHSDARWRSAIEVITTHEVSSLSRDPLYNELIQAKWSAFGRRLFLTRTVVPYALYVALFIIATWFRCRDVREGWKEVHRGLKEDKDVGLYDEVLERWEDGYVMFQLCTQVLLVLTSLYILVMGVMTRRLGPRDIDPDEDGGTMTSKMKRIIHKNLIFILNTAISVCVIGSTGFRIAGADRLEMALLAVGNVLIFCNFMQTLAPIKPIGVLVILIWRIAVHDVLICLALYLVLLCAFSGAQFCIYQRSDFVHSLEASGGMRLDEAPTTAMLRNIYVSMGEVNTTDLLLMSNTPWLVLLLHITWIVVANVLMMNLLIAMMSWTIDDGLQYAHEMWIFPFAREVLRYEKMLQEESTMTGPSLLHPAFSFKYLLHKAASYPFRAVRALLCCVGGSRSVAPEAKAEDKPPEHEGSGIIQLARQATMKQPPQKKRYHQTRRRQFLVHRTGESDQTHKKFMSEEEISKAKFYRMELTLPALGSKARLMAPVEFEGKADAGGAASVVGSLSSEDDTPAVKQQKRAAKEAAAHLEEEVGRLRAKAEAMEVGLPLQLPRRSAGSFSSKASLGEDDDAEVLRRAKREMDKGLMELEELSKGMAGLEGSSSHALMEVLRAGEEAVRLKEEARGGAPRVGGAEEGAPAKQRRVAEDGAAGAGGSERLQRVEKELVQNLLELPGVVGGDAGDRGGGGGGEDGRRSEASDAAGT